MTKPPDKTPAEIMADINAANAAFWKEQASRQESLAAGQQAGADSSFVSVGRAATNNEKSRALEAALRKLPLVADREWLIPTVADTLAIVGSSAKAGGANRFLSAGQSATERELRRLASAARRLGSANELGDSPAVDSLAKRLRLVAAGIHGSTVDALAAVGVVDPFRAAADGKLAGALAQARMVDCPARGRHGPRENLRVGGIARAVGRAFFQLTGKRPTVSTIAARDGEGTAYGPFLDLMTSVFRVLQVRGNAEHYARREARRSRKTVN